MILLTSPNPMFLRPAISIALVVLAFLYSDGTSLYTFQSEALKELSPPSSQVTGLWSILSSLYTSSRPVQMDQHQGSKSSEMVKEEENLEMERNDFSRHRSKSGYGHADHVDPIVARYGYNPASSGQQKLSSNSYFEELYSGRNRSQIGKENATIVMLVRNSELPGALSSMRSLEDRFNKQYRYPWVFLNDVPFDEDFIQQTTAMASGKTFYELIPEEDWNPPPHIDLKKLEQNIQQSSHVIYGFSRSYRNMCHFNSGYFYRQKRLLDYEWYFRVEPDVEYMCDFMYDPFSLLRSTNKTYGFTITIPEYEDTIPTLWQTVEEFMAKHPEHLHPNNALDFITTNDTDVFHSVQVESKTNYNLCHFWSNFEIGNLNFFRGQAYSDYFDHLDAAGGFYYERWGDAPVHSIGLALLLDRDAIHHFEDIGYYHPPYMSCPGSFEVKSMKRCICRHFDEQGQHEGVDVKMPSCLARWWRHGAGKKFLNEVNYLF